MYKISIISPVYNVEKYIINCIDSILKQTLEDIEIVFVDDHGTDNSIKKAKEYIARQKTNKVFRFTETPVNSGPGPARNTGLEIAQGEYVAFIDSDDKLETTYCEELYQTAKKYDCDLCCCQAWMDFNADRRSILLKSPVIENGTLSEEDKKRFLTEFVPYHTTFLFKKTFVTTNQIIYPKERSAEDSYFVIMLVLSAKRMAQVRNPLYHYIIRSDSVSKSINNLRYRDKLSVFDQMLVNTKKRGIYTKFKSEIDFLYIKKGFLMSVFEYVLNIQIPDPEIITEIYQELVTQIPDYNKNQYFRKKIPFRIVTYFINKVPSLATKLLKTGVKVKKL